MPVGMHKKISNKYCPMFGQTALEMGFITIERLNDALSIQIDDDISKKKRLVPAILFEKDWMNSDQIEVVLNQMLKQMRIEKKEQQLIPETVNNC